MRPRIFSISYDQSLLQTRHMLLQQAGYDVTSAFGFAESIELCHEHYDLIIMGHSIPQKDKRAIVAELAKRGCVAPVLSLLRHGDHPIPEATQAILPDPQLLLDTVRAMVGTASAARV